MKPTTLLILGVVTVGVVALTALTSGKDGAAEQEESGKLFEGLDERVNDVTEVRIESGGDVLTLALADGAWGLAERGGYPVTFEQVKQTVMGIAELEIQEPKTSKPANYPQLGVQDPGDEGSTSTLVTLRDAGGAELASVVLGNNLDQRGGQVKYVRRAGEAQAFLCRGSRFKPEADPSRWLDRQIVKLDNARVEAVEVVHADGETVRVERDATPNAEFELAGLPEGRELRYAGITTGLGTALASLSLDDVRPIDEVNFAAEPHATARFTCFDGLELVVEMATFEDAKWARLSARATATDAVDAGSDEEGSSPLPAKTPAEVAAEVEEFNARLTRWAFALPPYKVDAIAKRTEEFLKELPPPSPLLPVEDGMDPVDEGAGETGNGSEDDTETPPASDTEPPAAPAEPGEPAEAGETGGTEEPVGGGAAAGGGGAR